MKKIFILLFALAFILSGCESEGEKKTQKETSQTRAASTASTASTAVSEKKEISFTIGKAERIDDIVPRLAEAIDGSEEVIYSLLNDGDFHIDYIEEIRRQGISNERKYLLEGYLLEGEYSIPEGAGEYEALEIILTAFENLYNEHREDFASSGRKIDEIVTVASIVEVETVFHEDAATTAGVFWNRIDSPDYPKLQSDRTVLYLFDGFGRRATSEELDTDSPYNTYKSNGLTPSAICNPSKESVLGSLFPEESDYYYFINCHDGKNKYAATYAEHRENYSKYLNGEL